MDTRHANEMIRNRRDEFLSVREIHHLRDLDSHRWKVETYEYNKNPFLHFRQMKKTNIELPTKNRIVFSSNYLSQFITALKTVREKRSPNWIERIHILHREKDFIVEIEKKQNTVADYLLKKMKPTSGSTLTIRQLKADKSGVYRPTRNEIKINNTRERTKKLIKALETI